LGGKRKKAIIKNKKRNAKKLKTNLGGGNTTQSLKKGNGLARERRTKGGGERPKSELKSTVRDKSCHWFQSLKRESSRERQMGGKRGKKKNHLALKTRGVAKAFETNAKNMF